jgi:hypothetical protein
LRKELSSFKKILIQETPFLNNRIAHRFCFVLIVVGFAGRGFMPS